jgi:hypothetical protein
MRRTLPSIIALLMSVTLVVTGVVLVVVGLDSKAQVKEALVAEHIVTPDDASIPGVPVDSAATAMSQAEIIQHHVLDTTGGKTWAQLDREDPLRAVYGSAASLRTSLMSAYMGFKVADLVTGLGALFFAMGLGGSVISALTLKAARRDEAAVATKADSLVTTG